MSVFISSSVFLSFYMSVLPCVSVCLTSTCLYLFSLVSKNLFFSIKLSLFDFQGGKTSDKCGRVVEQGISDDAERDLIVSLHNQLRAKIANGLEDKGNPGPQFAAANMMELVRYCLLDKNLSFL